MTDMTRKCPETDIDIDTIETIESLATQLSHEEFILLCNRKRPTRQTEKEGQETISRIREHLARKRRKPACHWCGLPLDRHGCCEECGEQFQIVF
jgi:hypothetical protein